MLSREENELLTKVGPGTRMGEVMRRYWLPILLSSELPEADCPPVRVRLLGEQLVAFRDSGGRLGLLDEFCAHRRASLWFGRNEEGGLRCVFHGWKYDVNGRCLDMMNEPEEKEFKEKIRLQAYPTVELGGLIWAYLGPPDRLPPPPCFEWTQVPETHRHVNKVWEECNWLQAMEGGLDSSHAPILHRALRPGARSAGLSPTSTFVRAGQPRLEVETTDYGYMYAAIRKLEDDQLYVRTHHYVVPFTQMRPQQVGNRNGPPGPFIQGHFWVPMDDENTMVYNWQYSFGGEPLSEERCLERGSGNEPWEVGPGFRKTRNKDNQYLIDRDTQRTETFTGIEGINTQDHAIQEGMGPIVDRTSEQLGPADRAIIVMRRLLLQALRAVQAGDDPPAASTSYKVRAIERVLPKDAPWREVLDQDIFHQGPEVDVRVAGPLGRE